MGEDQLLHDAVSAVLGQMSKIHRQNKKLRGCLVEIENRLAMMEYGNVSLSDSEDAILSAVRATLRSHKEFE